MKNVSDRMALMAKAKICSQKCDLRDSFFIAGGQYTTFVDSRPENANYCLTPRPESWHFPAVGGARKNFFVITELRKKKKKLCMDYYKFILRIVER